MTTLAIHLEEDLKSFVDESVDQGAFVSPSELIGVALRSYKAERGNHLAKLNELRKAVSLGLEQADRGEFVEFSADSIITEAKSAKLQG